MNIWLEELTGVEKDFHEQVARVNTWDLILCSNSVKMMDFADRVERLKVQQDKMDRHLEFIASQQSELEQQVIGPFEKMKSDFGLTVSDTATQAREETYSMLEGVTNDVHTIGGDLKDFIKKVNEQRSAQEDENDPLAQFGKVLNAHMNALQWIEEQTKTIDARLASALTSK